MDEGRRLAEEALAEARLAGASLSSHARAHLLQSLGQICWWHGDPPSTVRYCTEAIQNLPDDVSPIVARAYISLATPSLYWRRLDEALAYAERGLEIAQRLEFKEIVPSAYTVLGNVLTRMGDTARAESCLRQAVEMASSLGLAMYERVMATGYLAYNLYGQGRIDEAQQLAEGALWSYAGNPDTYEVYVCRSVLADIALERGQLDEAERLFTQLLEVGERRQFRIPLSMVCFGLAYIALAAGRQAEGMQLARRSLDLIEPTNAVQLYQDQGERAWVVCGALQAAGVRSNFIDRIMQQWSAAAAVQIHVAEAAAVVAVRCLGQLAISVDGQEIAPEQWNSAKARDLLALFVTCRHERLHIERVLEAMWPEASSQGKRAFHTALYRLRQTLRASGRESKFILVEAGEYWLELCPLSGRCGRVRRGAGPSARRGKPGQRCCTGCLSQRGRSLHRRVSEQSLLRLGIPGTATTPGGSAGCVDAHRRVSSGSGGARSGAGSLHAQPAYRSVTGADSLSGYAQPPHAGERGRRRQSVSVIAGCAG